MIQEFLSTYGMTIIYSIVTAIFGYIGLLAKRFYTDHVNTKEKKEVVAMVVLGIEQMYKNLNGDEKLSKAIEAASEILEEKGICISEFELRMLIESAVAGYNGVFWKEKDNAAVIDSEEIEE